MHLNLENIADYQNFPKKIFTTKLVCFNNAINYVIYQQRLEMFEFMLKDFLC